MQCYLPDKRIIQNDGRRNIITKSVWIVWKVACGHIDVVVIYCIASNTLHQFWCLFSCWTHRKRRRRLYWTIRKIFDMYFESRRWYWEVLMFRDCDYFRTRCWPTTYGMLRHPVFPPAVSPQQTLWYEVRDKPTSLNPGGKINLRLSLN